MNPSRLLYLFEKLLLEKKSPSQGDQSLKNDNYVGVEKHFKIFNKKN